MRYIEVKPDDTSNRIREYIRSHPEVRKDEYTSEEDPLHGSCYVAAEAFFHAKGGTESGLDIYCLSWKDVDPTYEGTHWFLREGDTIYDLSLPTAAIGSGIPFTEARRRAFLTGYEPSRRCQRLLDGLDIDY